MAYTITKNDQYNSVEVIFDGKPEAPVRDALKALRFRWHGLKKCWYGYKTAEEVEAAIKSAESGENCKETVKKYSVPVIKSNKFGVKVGDLFHASWGYDQTNNDFFQVVALVGESSVRVREVHPPMIESRATGPDAEDRVFKITKDLLPAAPFSVFIKDQEKGDLKRLKSYAADGKSNPQFNLSSFANAYYCGGDTIKVYESWYA